LVLLFLLAGAGAYIAQQASELARARASILAAQENAAQPLRAGRDAFEKGDYQMAETHFSGLVAREPQNSEAHLWLGRAQLAKRDFASAAQSFEQAIRLQPAMYEAYLGAAGAYEAAGDTQKARRALSLAGEQLRQAAPR
ncbi:MAG TPA: tetratricopeptide repeat protein, partial [Blastocatellia bacterium]